MLPFCYVVARFLILHVTVSCEPVSVSEATRHLLYCLAFSLCNWTFWDLAEACIRPKIHSNRAELSSELS